MKITSIILSTILTTGYIASSGADTPPKNSPNYSSNYQTLLKDQKVSPPVAHCIATGYDYIKTSKNYDRLGFTREDIAAAKTSNKPENFSTKNSLEAFKVITIPGEARLHKIGYKWDSVVLRCSISKGKITAIELAPASGF